jgi:hypothetical protein
VIDTGLRSERRAVLRKSVGQRGGLAGEKLVFQIFAFKGGGFWFHTGSRSMCRATFDGSLAPDGGCQEEGRSDSYYSFWWKILINESKRSTSGSFSFVRGYAGLTECINQTRKGTANRMQEESCVIRPLKGFSFTGLGLDGSAE